MRSDRSWQGRRLSLLDDWESVSGETGAVEVAVPQSGEAVGSGSVDSVSSVASDQGSVSTDQSSVTSDNGTVSSNESAVGTDKSGSTDQSTVGSDNSTCR